MGGAEDRKWLGTLTHYERENIIQERHKNRELLLKKKHLQKDQPIDVLPTTQLKKRLAIIEEEGEGDNLNMLQRSDRFTDKRVKTETDYVLALNPTEDLQKLNSICLKRGLLFKLQNHLYFEECVRNCLVKISCRSTSGKQDYKIGMITGVRQIADKQYTFERKSYDKYLSVLIGEEDFHDIPLSNVSNKEIDEQEAFGLLSKLRTIVTFRLDLDWVQGKQRDLENYLNYQFKGEDFSKIFARQMNKMEGSSETALIRKKNLIDNQLNHLKTQNFHEYDAKRAQEIVKLETLINEINIELKKFDSDKLIRRTDEQFLAFNKVS